MFFIVENFPFGGQTVLSEPLGGVAPWPPSGSAYVDFVEVIQVQGQVIL